MAVGSAPSSDPTIRNVMPAMPWRSTTFNAAVKILSGSRRTWSLPDRDVNAGSRSASPGMMTVDNVDVNSTDNLIDVGQLDTSERDPPTLAGPDAPLNKCG